MWFTSNIKKLISLVLFVPLFAVFAGAVMYVFHRLGTICSVHVSETAGMLHNLLTPFIASPYAPGQLVFTSIAIVTLALIFASSVLKAFSRSTTTLLLIAFVAFLAGLFTPEVPFLETNRMVGIFSPEYFPCYFVLAVAWVLSLCFTINRTFIQGFLGAALVVLAMETAFLSAHLSIPPDQKDIFFTVLFYASLFCGLCTIFYLIARSAKDNLFLPAVLFLLAVTGIWIYTVSGLISTVNDTMNVLITRVPVKVSSNANNQDSGTGVEKDFNWAKDRFSGIDRTNELTGLSEQEAVALLDPRINKAIPGGLNENFKPLFTSWLTRYYQGGSDNMKIGIWEFALTLPLRNFNRDAQENDAYFFLLGLLYTFGLLSCAGTILFKEEL